MTIDTSKQVEEIAMDDTTVDSERRECLIEKTPIIKHLQEDEWHRQWIERNTARYRTERAMAVGAGGR